MDKWDECTDRIKNAVLAEEPEAALTGALEMFGHFGRTLELLSMDMDRIATALEDRLPDPVDDTIPAAPSEPAPAPLDL